MQEEDMDFSSCIPCLSLEKVDFYESTFSRLRQVLFVQKIGQDLTSSLKTPLYKGILQC